MINRLLQKCPYKPPSSSSRRRSGRAPMSVGFVLRPTIISPRVLSLPPTKLATYDWFAPEDDGQFPFTYLQVDNPFSSWRRLAPPCEPLVLESSARDNGELVSSGCENGEQDFSACNNESRGLLRVTLGNRGFLRATMGSGLVSLRLWFQQRAPLTSTTCDGKFFNIRRI
jgi:hypothetical protein